MSKEKRKRKVLASESDNCLVSDGFGVSEAQSSQQWKTLKLSQARVSKAGPFNGQMKEFLHGGQCPAQSLSNTAYDVIHFKPFQLTDSCSSQR
jgi:hypothetical protein